MWSIRLQLNIILFWSMLTAIIHCSFCTVLCSDRRVQYCLNESCTQCRFSNTYSAHTRRFAYRSTLYLQAVVFMKDIAVTCFLSLVSCVSSLNKEIADVIVHSALVIRPMVNPISLAIVLQLCYSHSLYHFQTPFSVR